MTSSSPLTGVILVDCAKANAKSGLAIATEQCGYGDDTAAFQSALQSACADMGVTIDDLSELLAEQVSPQVQKKGMTIAPDSPKDI